MEKSYNLPVHPNNRCEAMTESGQCLEQASAQLLVEGMGVISMKACYFHTKAATEGLSRPSGNREKQIKTIDIKTESPASDNIIEQLQLLANQIIKNAK